MHSAPSDEAEKPSPDLPIKRPEIITSLSGYTPPFDPVPIVERMLASVPPEYLVGLKEVVLTNSSGLSRKLRRAVTKSRKRKVKIVEARDLYHQQWHGQQAWIEIFVDNTLKECEKNWWSRLSFLREAELADVLFHEIGHHIHFTTRPEYREREDVADVWKVRLRKNYFRERRPVLQALFYPVRPIIRVLLKAIKKSMVQRGRISRAEFDEDFRRGSTRN
jgi:hypothetical protein